MSKRKPLYVRDVDPEVVPMVENVRGVHLDHDGRFITCGGMFLTPTPYGWCITSWAKADDPRLRDCPDYPDVRAEIMNAIDYSVVVKGAATGAP